MNITKTISTVGVGAAIVAGSMFAVNAAGAQHGGTDTDKSERITALAEKLGVDEASVEGAFSELREEHKAEREVKHAEHLAGLVSDGTLTQEQADALSAKQADLKDATQALKDSGATREEVKEQMKTAKDEFKSWAEDQGIDLESIRSEGGRKGHRGGHGQHGPEDSKES